MYVVVVEVVAHRNECFTTCKLKGGKRSSSKYKYRLLLVLPSSSSSFAYGEAVRRNFLHSMRVLLNIGTSGIGAKYIG